MADKHNAVTAASMKRRARDHREAANSHRRVAQGQRGEGYEPWQREVSLAMATVHAESAGILEKEAKEIRGHFKKKEG